MNEHQRNILELARTTNLATITLREIGQRLGIDSPQLVRHHINQLVRSGHIWIDRKAGKMRLTGQSNSSLMHIPILGAANCGVATLYADETVPEGFVSISPGLLKLDVNHSEKYFAIRAVGDSMNNAKVPTFGGVKTGIDEGDIVVIDKTMPDIQSKPYIVAIIDGLTNIKRLVLGEGVARLESESRTSYTPIFIDPQLENFIAGRVVAVVKG